MCPVRSTTFTTRARRGAFEVGRGARDAQHAVSRMRSPASVRSLRPSASGAAMSCNSVASASAFARAGTEKHFQPRLLCNLD